MATEPEIVGRDLELRTLRELVLGRGPPHAVFVEGDAGVGKTALLEAVTAEALTAGSLVLGARPTAAEAASSYAALADLLEPVIAASQALPTPQRRALSVALLLEESRAPVDSRLVAYAARSLLGSLEGPVLLAVDDWQWLDAATLAVLSFVLRRLEPEGPNVVATVRSGEADEGLATLLRSLPAGVATELPLAPLGPAEIGRLIQTRSGRWLAPPALARLHASCAGNPLLALELMRAPGAERATDVRRLIARRLAALPGEARTALRLAAALAEPTVEVVEREAAAGLEAALAADLVVCHGSRLRFTHPLIAAVVEERTPRGEWRALHARLARSAESPEQRARHLAAAAEGPDETVASALAEAGAMAEARGAATAAAELAEQAAALTPAGDTARRHERMLAAAGAWIFAGDGARARAPLDEVLESAPAGPVRAQALHKLAYLVTDGSGAELIAAALAEAGDDETLCADIELSAALFAAMGGDVPSAIRACESAARRAEAAGETFLLSQALNGLAYFRHRAGEGVQRRLLLRADALEREAPGRARDDTSLEILGLQLYNQGELAEARELLLGERQRARQRGYLDHEAFASLLLAELEVRAGRWQLAESHARGALELTQGSGRWNDEAAARWACALVDAHLGRVEAALEQAEAGRQLASDLGDLAYSTRCAHVLGFLALSRGDGAEAVRRLLPLRSAEQRLGIHEPAAFCIGPDLAEALMLAGDLVAAREVQSELEERGRALGRAWAIATGLRCRGLIAAAEGRSGDALSDLHEALGVHDDVPQPFDRARTLLALGTVQRRAKHRAEARATLESALAVFEELGATLWAERARAEITRLGGRRARDRDELTETERQIAALAAEGRSNREIAGELFVSERTVEANLTRAYRKLGVRSRTELARRLPAD